MNQPTFKDVAHLYAKADVDIETNIGFTWGHGYTVYRKLTLGNVAEIIKQLSNPEGDYFCKPILRPLHDMTEKEAIELYKLNPYSKGLWLIQSAVIKENVKGYEPNIIQINWGGKDGHGCGYASGSETIYFNKLTQFQHLYMLDNGFDIFGLIKLGQAIDETEYKQAIQN